MLKVKDTNKLVHYNFAKLSNGCYEANVIKNEKENIQYSIFVDLDNILSIRVNNDINYNKIEKLVNKYGEKYLSVDDIYSYLFVDTLIDNLSLIYKMIKDDCVELVEC